jgi:F-type H+-transporting ATPase subunit a
MAAEVSLAAEPIAHIGSFTMTNSMLATVIVTAGFIIFALLVRKKITAKAEISGSQNVLEFVFEGAIGLMDSITGKREQTNKFFPLAMTLFLFILVANWFGLLPGVGPIGLHEVHEGKEILVPLLRGASADLNTTLALAAVSLFSFQFFGIATVGFFKYASKFINVKNPIKFFLGIVELISEVAKLISLSFRLFGNIFAGEVLLLIIGVLVPIIAPLPFFALELFVGFIQAFIFAMLTVVFLRVATEMPH